MKLEEFNRLTGLQLEDKIVYDKVHQIYMESTFNKYGFVAVLMRVFKEWVWENLNNLTNINKEQLFKHFVIYELDPYLSQIKGEINYE